MAGSAQREVPVVSQILVGSIILGGSATVPVAAQVTPTPLLQQQAGAGCPAQVQLRYDVSSLQANGIRWELRRSGPGVLAPATSAAVIDQGAVRETQSSVQRDLRSYGATLDGSTYYARIVATQGNQEAAAWSAVASYGPTLAPNGMFTATAVTSSAPPQLRLQWGLTGGLGQCADRIVYELKQGSPFASTSAADPNTTLVGTAVGLSGSLLIPITTGPGDYYVRILAHHGGDTPNRSTGSRSAAVRISFPAPVQVYTVDLSVLDASATACAGSSVGRAGATVRLSGNNQNQSQSTDAQGRVRFSVPSGTYTVEASQQGCTSAATSISVTGNTQRSLTLTNCDAARADVAVSLGGTTNPPGGTAYSLPTTLRNLGTARSASGQLNVRRTTSTGSNSLLANYAAPALCPGETRSYTPSDPSPVGGQSYTYIATTDVVDLSSSNNTASRSVIFTAVLVASQPAVPSVSITSFRIRGGLPYVTNGPAVSLNATADGLPSFYRVAERRLGCTQDLGSLGWQSWSAGTPPSRRFSGTGLKQLCFQLARGNDGSGASNIMEDAIRVVNGVYSSPYAGNGEFVFLRVSSTADLVSPWPFVVGLNLRAGSVIDALGTRTAQLGPNGEPSALNDTRNFGGSGGTALTRMCSSGEAVSGIRGRYGLVLDRIEVACRPWRRDIGANGSHRWLAAAGGSGGDQTFTLTCPTPLAVFRVNAGTVGTVVGGVGIICVVPPGM